MQQIYVFFFELQVKAYFGPRGNRSPGATNVVLVVVLLLEVVVIRFSKY